MIKLILLCGLLTAALLLFRRPATPTTMAFRRTSFCALMIVGAGAVLFPSAVTAVANALGVVRGTDLILYLLVVTFFLTSVSYSRRLYELEERYVALVRSVALTEARIVADLREHDPEWGSVRNAEGK